jgi:hypothetical protein
LLVRLRAVPRHAADAEGRGREEKKKKKKAKKKAEKKKAEKKEARKADKKAEKKAEKAEKKAEKEIRQERQVRPQGLTMSSSDNSTTAAWFEDRIAAAVAPLLPGFTVEAVAEIDSTNTELMRRARAGRTEPVLLVAERQTAGRGRLGRPWQSARSRTNPQPRSCSRWACRWRPPTGRACRSPWV